MVNQVIKRNAIYRNAQLAHMGKIGLAQLAGLMNLGEKYFFGGSLRGPPMLYFSLQGSQLTVGKAPWISPLKILVSGHVKLSQKRSFKTEPLVLCQNLILG